MKRTFGKLYKSFLCFIAIFICMQSVSYAYETVLIDFPNKGWHKVYYKQKQREIIGQYVPTGQTSREYLESLVVHSYKWAGDKGLKPLDMLQYHIQQAQSRYHDVEVAYIKNDYNDTIAVWCSEKTSQCEIIRSTQGYEGIITMHYINKNPAYFQRHYYNWLDIVKNIKVYYSYYRWNELLNKESAMAL